MKSHALQWRPSTLLPPTKDLNSDPSLTSVLMYFTWLIIPVLTTMHKCLLYFVIGRLSLWWRLTWKQMLNSLLLVVLVLCKMFSYLWLLWVFVVARGLLVAARVFSSCGEQRLLSSFGARAFHCGSFCCCKAQAVECPGFSSSWVLAQ